MYYGNLPIEMESISCVREPAVPVRSKEDLKEDLRERELMETDLTRRKMFRAVSEALDATRIIVNKYGTPVGEVADHTVRLAAAREAREILGETARKDASTGKMPAIIIKHSDGTVMAIGGG